MHSIVQMLLQVNTHHSTWALKLWHAGAFSYWDEIHVGRNRGTSVCQQLSLHGGLSDMNEVSPQYAAPQVSVRLEAAKASLILIKWTHQQAVSAAENSTWMKLRAPPALSGGKDPVMVQGNSLCGAMKCPDDPVTEQPKGAKCHFRLVLKKWKMPCHQNYPELFIAFYRRQRNSEVWQGPCGYTVNKCPPLLPGFFFFYVNAKWH